MGGASHAGFLESVRSAAAHVVVDDVGAPSLSESDRHHLASVLRLRDGERVSVTDGRGAWRLCRFAPGPSLAPDGEAGHCDRSSPAVCVAFAPVKGDRTEWAVQKLTELGVDRMILLRTERVVVRWDGPRAVSHLRKLEAVARQALMQSRGLWLPSIEGVVDFEEAVSLPGAALAEPGGDPLPPTVRTILVGPEGGWSDGERATSAGLPTVGLGPGVLRTETAAVAAGVLLAALRSGMVSPSGTVGSL